MRSSNWHGCDISKNLIIETKKPVVMTFVCSCIKKTFLVKLDNYSLFIAIGKPAELCLVPSRGTTKNLTTVTRKTHSNYSSNNIVNRNHGQMYLYLDV